MLRKGDLVHCGDPTNLGIVLKDENPPHNPEAPLFLQSVHVWVYWLDTNETSTMKNRFLTALSGKERKDA